MSNFIYMNTDAPAKDPYVMDPYIWKGPNKVIGSKFIDRGIQIQGVF